MSQAPERIQRYLENRQAEIDSANQYRYLEASEKDSNLAQVYRRLAEVEEAHIQFWEKQLSQVGVKPRSRAPSWRSRLLVFFARHFSRQAMLSTIAAGERTDRNAYAVQPESAQSTMASQERWHSRVLQEILRNGAKSGQASGMEGSFLARIEGRHRAAGGNVLRAAVLGANDGLCSNLSLVMGVAGADSSSHALLLTGLAGLLAGAFSMALGEFVSVTSARELAEREIRIEADELEADIHSEARELQLIYQAKGIPEKDAGRMAEQILKDPEQALNTLAREELGIDPEDLGGSAWEAAIASFSLFALGASIPVLPFLFTSGRHALGASLGLSAAGLFLIGALITIFTGKPLVRSGLRQLLLGLCAAGVTYTIGHWVGATLR